MNAIIKAQAVTLQYSTDVKPIISDLNLEITIGSFVVVTGKSGSGKTTLVQSLYGEKTLDAGTMHVCGFNLTGYIGGLGHQSQKHLDTLVRDIFRI